MEKLPVSSTGTNAQNFFFFISVKQKIVFFKIKMFNFSPSHFLNYFQLVRIRDPYEAPNPGGAGGGVGIKHVNSFKKNVPTNVDNLKYNEKKET